MSNGIPGDIANSRETILRAATKFHIYFLLAIALVGAIMAVVGIFQMIKAGEHALKGVPEYAILMVIGFIAFSLFFPWFTALFFARHFLVATQRLETENRELRTRLEAVERLLQRTRR